MGWPQKRLRERRMTCQAGPVSGMATLPAAQPRAYEPMGCGGRGAGVFMWPKSFFAGFPSTFM